MITTESEASSIDGTFKKPSETSIKLTLGPANLKNRNLSENEKINILSSSTSSLVSSFHVTKGRKYSLDWEITFPWLRYSVTENSAYCAYCLVFDDGEGLFRTVGFNDWKNAIGEKRGTFISSMEKADNLVITKSYEEKVSRNRQIVLAIIDVVVILGAKKP